MTMMTETLVSGTTPVSDNVNLKQHLNTPSEEGQTLRGSVEKALHNYFAHLEGAAVTDVYNLVLSEVEAPLLESVMNYVKGNQTKASELLGQHVQWCLGDVQNIQLATAHAVEQGGALDQIVAGGGEQTSLGRAADLVPGAPDSL